MTDKSTLPATVSVAELLAAHVPNLPAPFAEKVAALPVPLLEKLLKYPFLDPDALDERTLMRTLTAESAEEVGAMPTTVALDEITGEPFWLIGIEGILPSNVRDHENEPYYLLVARWDDGRQFTVTTGSKFCITRFVRWDELGALPRRVMSTLVEGKRDPSRSSLWLVDAPLRANAHDAAITAVAVAEGDKTGATDEEPF